MLIMAMYGSRILEADKGLTRAREKDILRILEIRHENRAKMVKGDTRHVQYLATGRLLSGWVRIAEESTTNSWTETKEMERSSQCAKHWTCSEIVSAQSSMIGSE